MLKGRMHLDNALLGIVDMLDLEKTRKDTEKFIIDAVAEQWKSHEACLLLSQLGSMLKREVPDSVYVIRDGIKTLLAQWPIVQMIPFPGIPEKIGLVPLDVVLPEDIRTIFQTNLGIRGKERPFSYNQKFWQSFYTAINKNRFVVTEDGQLIDVVSDVLGNTPANYHEITPADLVTPSDDLGYSERIELTHKHIDAWLERHGFDRENFSSVSVAGHTSKHGSKIDDIYQAFGRLSQDDQARIVIPLDILIKLMAKN